MFFVTGPTLFLRFLRHQVQKQYTCVKWCVCMHIFHYLYIMRYDEIQKEMRSTCGCFCCKSIFWRFRFQIPAQACRAAVRILWHEGHRGSVIASMKWTNGNTPWGVGQETNKTTSPSPMGGQWAGRESIPGYHATLQADWCWATACKRPEAYLIVDSWWLMEIHSSVT